MEFFLSPEEIARVCHEANRAYCMATGDHSQPTWDMAPEWHKSGLKKGIESVLANIDRSPEENHAAWLEDRKAAGWKFGPKKVPEVLEHPCMVPYDELPKKQQAKDHLFLSVVKALSQWTFDEQKDSPPPPDAEFPVDQPKSEDTGETGILTDDGDVVKNSEVDTVIKPKKSKSKKV